MLFCLIETRCLLVVESPETGIDTSCETAIPGARLKETRNSNGLSLALGVTSDFWPSVDTGTGAMHTNPDDSDAPTALTLTARRRVESICVYSSLNTSPWDNACKKIRHLQPKKLLDQVRDKIRFKHYSLSTEHTYLSWIKQFIVYHGKRHPNDMGAIEVEAFLTYLANQRHVSVSRCVGCGIALARSS